MEILDKNDSSTQIKSSYSSLYKATGKPNQNKRREELLAEQKRRRQNILDDARGICPSDTVGSSNHNRKKYFREYKNKIMLSEWLIEIPPDFDVSWFMKICPQGHRNLVVAHNNRTKTYSKHGRFEYKFKSLLPGGFGGDSNSLFKTTILDCIWNPKTNSFYIVDVLIWADYDVREYDAEFRFFWLQSKISESPELEVISNHNEYSFHYVPHYICDYLSIKDNLEKYPCYEDNSPAVDGLLFYHKEASYSAGRIPLVGWLKPYMVPEILNAPIAPEYFSSKPKNYVNLAQHLEEVKRNKHAKKCTNSEMDMS